MRLIDTMRIFLSFVHRDIMRQKKFFLANLINYGFIYPISLGVMSAFLQGNTFFASPSKEMNTILFVGNILLVLMLFSYKQNIELLFDLESRKFIEYQITVLNPFLVLLERILFTGIYGFLLALPFYPMIGLLLSDYVTLEHTSWPKVAALLLLGSLWTSAYHLLAAVVLKSSANISTLWARVNSLIFMLGGFWIPWYVLNQFSPALGYAAYLNPALYMTDGLKGAITANSAFIPFWICISALSGFIILSIGSCYWRFKRRVDCL